MTEQSLNTETGFLRFLLLKGNVGIAVPVKAMGSEAVSLLRLGIATRVGLRVG